jgi:hypothetical protein
MALHWVSNGERLPDLFTVEYMPSSTRTGYFGDRKLMRSMKESDLISKTIVALVAENNFPLSFQQCVLTGEVGARPKLVYDTSYGNTL